MEKFNYDELTDAKRIEILDKASNEESQKDYFQKLRKRIADFIEKNPNAKGLNYLLMMPDFFYLVCRLLGDNRVPPKSKLKIGAAIVYCISPIDIIPDILGVPASNLVGKSFKYTESSLSKDSFIPPPKLIGLI